MTEGSSRVRLGVVGIIVMALFSGLFARLWFLQVGSSSKSYAAQTAQNRIRVINAPSVRGSILDSAGRYLVQNELVNTIQVRRGLTAGERRAMVPRLAKVLGVTTRYINLRLDSVRYSPYQPVPIKDQVKFSKVVYIKERPEMFPKVDAVRRSIRVYPSFTADQTYAAHLLGYVGAANADELKLHKGEGYGPDDIIGKTGVEQVFESELRGSPEVRKLEVDSRGRLVRTLSDKKTIPGNDVQLTMNLDVQRIAEESLAQGMQKAASHLKDPTVKDRFKTYGAKGGAAVVLDATDGSVVALASAPTFDVTKFTDGIPIEGYAALNAAGSNYPLLDRAIQGQYAPGSTFKLFTAIAALENHITTAGRGLPRQRLRRVSGAPRRQDEQRDLRECSEGSTRSSQAAHCHPGVERRVLLHAGVQVLRFVQQGQHEGRIRHSACRAGVRIRSRDRRRTAERAAGSRT